MLMETTVVRHMVSSRLAESALSNITPKNDMRARVSRKNHLENNPNLTNALISKVSQKIGSAKLRNIALMISAIIASVLVIRTDCMSFMFELSWPNLSQESRWSSKMFSTIFVREDTSALLFFFLSTTLAMSTSSQIASKGNQSNDETIILYKRLLLVPTVYNYMYLTAQGLRNDTT